MDLTNPEYGNGVIGQVIGPSGGTTWTRIMFERQVLGEEYWARQAATKPVLYPSGAPLSDALVRGEVQISPVLYNIVWTKKRDGAPLEIFFPPEGVPINPYASGIPKTAAHANAARLFLNWSLSEEGQTFMIKELGNLTSLKRPPFYPAGFDPKVVKVWVPNFEQYQKLHAEWMEQWNKTYGYRQRRERRSVERGDRAHVGGTARRAAAQGVRDGPARGRRRELRCRRRRDRRAARPVRLRQDDDAALRRRARAAERRDDRHRRRRRVGAAARRAGAPAQAQHRHGVPVLRRVAAHDGVAERGLSPAHAPARARRARGQGRGAARAGPAVA